MISSSSSPASDPLPKLAFAAWASRIVWGVSSSSVSKIYLQVTLVLGATAESSTAPGSIE